MSTKATKPIRQKKGNVLLVKNLKFNKKQMVSNQFKPRKTRIADDFMVNNEEDENGAEFRFLYKLYVPNYLIKNNKVSMTDLMPYLPILVGDDDGENVYGEINLELHLFLSSIMVNYINSWYLTKLNTDNYDFIIEVYDLLTKFTKDICKRILDLVLDYDNMFDLLDKLSSVVNDHISNLAKDKDKDGEYDLKIINDYYEKCQKQNIPNDQVDIVSSYLSSQHVIFQTSHLVYFRLLVEKLLELTLHTDSPMNSQIGSSLVISLLSDLVLDKLFQKLSSPQFILENINKIVLIGTDKLKPTNKTKPSIWKKIDGLYKTTKNLVNFTWPTYKLKADILNNHVFQLLNTLTGFTERVPYFSSAILLITNTIHQNRFFNSKLNSLAVQSLKTSYKAPIFSQKEICHQISTLRQEIFYKKDQDEETDKREITIPILIENIQLLKRLLLEKSPLSDNFLDYQYESEQEFKTCLNNILLIFNYPSSDTINQTCQLNQLLIINILDVIIHQLYPQI